MDKHELKTLFQKLTVWKRKGQRAPHKPLLILYALGRCYRTESRMVTYSEVDPTLHRLLVAFGPFRRKYHPELPFWHLQNDGLWVIEGAEQVQFQKGRKDASRGELLKHNVRGGFPEEIYSQLSAAPNLLIEVANEMLDSHFPTSIHEDILQVVGIDPKTERFRRPKRDHLFRDEVLRAYEYRCAICGFDVRLEDSLIALEAAHIKWHRAGGPDIVGNGIALCSLHHKLFDRGAFTLTNSMCAHVSERAHGTRGFKEWLMAFHGKKISSPQRPSYYPKDGFIQWHIREVFRGPAKYLLDSCR